VKSHLKRAEAAPDTPLGRSHVDAFQANYEPRLDRIRQKGVKAVTIVNLAHHFASICGLMVGCRNDTFRAAAM
jgi:hypothetical protein